MNLNDGMCGRYFRGNKKKIVKAVTIQRGQQRDDKPSRRSEYSDETAAVSSNWKISSGNATTALNTSSTSRSFLNSFDAEQRTILALTEGRGTASFEVGIASINLSNPVLILCQISDTPSYVNVLTKINVLNPIEIIIPTTIVSSRLTEKLKQKFPMVKITGLPRSFFNKTTGMQYVTNVCASVFNSIVLTLQYKYYALTATCALMSYLEGVLYIYYAKEAMKVEYQESEGNMIIDIFTADKLELVACALPDNTKFSSLFGILNHCVTKIGVRTLRASILQPCSSVPEIEERLDCIQELIRLDQFDVFQELLKQVSNIDQLLSLTTILPDQAENCRGRQMNYILLLNAFFDLLEPLYRIFEHCEQPFFVRFCTVLSCDEFQELKNLVRKTIRDDARPGVGEKGEIERCFAIRDGVNGLLDIVRQSYSNRMEEMIKYVQTLASKYGLDLKLSNNNKKGYHISMPLNYQQRKSFNSTSLPEEFIEVQRSTTMVTMKTYEILVFSARLEDVMVEILQLSNVIVYNILLQTKKCLDLFYKLCEYIAKLDMLQSLAQRSKSSNYVRPTFSSILDVSDGRHPLLEFLRENEPIANSYQASKRFNMHIITGPNGSGKSIFIRQIVLLQVMAQVGCYVPASAATFRAADRILAKIYLEDNMDCGLSAFVYEMKEIQHFLNVLTENSLIIIDELCRSTSVKEGTALAMGICEKFLSTPAFVFFTTHYTFITKLYDMYYNVKCWQLEALPIEINSRRTLKFTYNVLPGVTCLKNYAITLASAIWHPLIMKDVESVMSQLRAPKEREAKNKIPVAARLKYNLEAELDLLHIKGELTFDIMQDKIQEYRLALINLNYPDIFLFPPGSGDSDSSFISAMQPEAVYSPPLNESSDNNSLFLPVEGLNNFNPVGFPYGNMETRLVDYSTDESFEMPVVRPDSDESFEFPNFTEDKSSSVHQNDFEFLVPQQVKRPKTSSSALNTSNASMSSIDEKQFIKTLKENVDRTSTPIVRKLIPISVDRFGMPGRSCEFKDAEVTGQLTAFNNSHDFSTKGLNSQRDAVENSEIDSEISAVIEEFSADDVDWDQSYLTSEEHCKVESSIDHTNSQDEESISYSPDYQQLANYDFQEENASSKSVNATKYPSTECDLSSGSKSKTDSALCQNSNGALSAEKPITPSTLSNEKGDVSEGPNTSFTRNSTSSGIQRVSDSRTASKSSLDADDENYITASSQLSELEPNKQEPKQGSYQTPLPKQQSVFENSMANISFNLPSSSNSTLPRRKPKPTAKLTKKEIEQEFRERDMQHLMQPESAERYGKEILNRPSAKSMSKCQEVVKVYKNEGGDILCTTPKKKPARPKFVPPFLRTVTSTIDVSIFSDRNARAFDDLMQQTGSSGSDFDKFKQKSSSSG